MRITQHALEEMQRRQISEQEVMVVCERPEQKIKLANAREIWQNKVVIERKTFVLRVVVDVEESKVITAYRSSKVKKYWREET